MQIARTAFAAALVVAAIAAPGASAAVAVDRSPAPVEAADPASGYARIAAHRDAMSTRHWQPAEKAPVVRLVRDGSDGFDWASAVIGASVPLALLLVDLLVRPALSRRRGRVAAHA